MKLILTLFGCLFLLSATLLQAQKSFDKGKPFVSNYSPNDYQAHVQNWSILQDQRGIIIIGNGDGIMEYDGETFRVTPLPNKTTIRSMDMDKDGRIYVGSVTEIGYLEPGERGETKFVSLMELLDETDRNFKDVWGTTVCGDKVYYRTYNKLFEYKDGEFNCIDAKTTYSSHLVFKNEYYARQDDVGLLKVENDTVKLAPGGEYFKDKGIPFYSKLKNKLIVARGSELYYYDPLDRKNPLEKIESNSLELLSKYRIYTGTTISEEEFGVGLLNRGCFVMDAKGQFVDVIGKEAGLQNLSTYGMTVDSDNGIWLALNKGVSRIEYGSPISFWTESDGLLGGVESIIRHKGVLYITTHRGFYYLDNGKVKDIGGVGSQCWSVLEFNNPENPDDNRLLMAGDRRIFEVKDFKLELIGRTNPLAPFELHQSKTNPARVFIGLSNGFAAIRFEKGKWIWEGSVEGFEDNIREMAEDQNGDIWLGSFRNGVYRIKQSDDFTKPEKITQYNDKHGLKSLKNILVYPFGDHLTFGTESGIMRFDYEKEMFVPDCSVTKNLCDGSRDVFSFIEDKKGNVWVAGLYNKLGEIGYAKKSGNSYTWMSKPFKRIPDMMVLAFYVEPDGTAWIGGTEGLYKYKKTDKTYAGKYHTLIRKVITKGDSILFDGANYTIKNDKRVAAIKQPDDFVPVLNYKYNSLTFKFSAPSYNHVKSNVYSYYLDGYDEDWSAWTELAQKQYTNLKEGEYIFKVKSKNIYGDQGSIAEYKFSIEPPVYRTIWAYILYVVVGVCFVWIVVKIYTRRLKEANIRLEKLVAERTKEVVKQKNKIEKAYKNVKQLSEIGKEITSNLSAKKIIETVYENINMLMDASVFGIGLYIPTESVIRFSGTIEKGQMLNDYDYSLSEETRLAIVCFLNEKDIIISDFENEYSKYFKQIKPKAGERPLSIIYLPLKVKEKEIGVITVQAFHKNAYDDYHVNILRNMAVYAGIALDNAEAYDKIENQAKELKEFNIQLQEQQEEIQQQAEELAAQAEVLQTTNSALEKEKEYTMGSIRYARTIQAAILPIESRMRQFFESFTIFWPKDIVSGDFYWFTSISIEGKGDFAFLGVIDCTGHGVPGAFMSMIGSRLFNEIVNEKQETNPARILELMDINVQKALKQDKSENDDGMDACLCRFEKSDNGKCKITFAGAKRPLFHWKAKEGEIRIIKGQRKSLGGRRLRTDVDFFNVDVKVGREDTLYLTTDGFVDQNEPSRKRYGTPRLLRKLREIANNTLSNQKEILESTLKEYMQDERQRDDITMMGVRIIGGGVLD